MQEKYKDKWEAIGPETGKNKLLWMVGEIGKVIDIVKKNGGTKACSDAELRNDLVEEQSYQNHKRKNQMEFCGE